MQSLQRSIESFSSSRNQNSLPKPFFSPFLVTPLKVQGDGRFLNDSACYNSKYNMVTACSSNRTVQFYDASTLEPSKRREVLDLEGSVTQMAFQSETDTYILGCNSGFIYKYNISRNELVKVKQCQNQVQGVVYLKSTLFAFPLFNIKKLYIGNLDHNDVVTFDLNENNPTSLHYSQKRDLLFLGTSNGSVMIYRTDKLPDLQILYSVQAHSAGNWVLDIQCIHVNGKEYIATAGDDWTVKIRYGI